ncbi:hypothetical protein QAD02_000699 [Eretmocerus hayati]|uniref:Uncharacterized protein n=1 Tax=Eretmocerus hayati TaxID=131215 RepID=A0ACC2NE46_9HYME|nr:hypothetical protein QAD02_000699 [Eretmocerus hayati]
MPFLTKFMPKVDSDPQANLSANQKEDYNDLLAIIRSDNKVQMANDLKKASDACSHGAKIGTKVQSKLNLIRKHRISPDAKYGEDSKPDVHGKTIEMLKDIKYTAERMRDLAISQFCNNLTNNYFKFPQVQLARLNDEVIEKFPTTSREDDFETFAKQVTSKSHRAVVLHLLTTYDPFLENLDAQENTSPNRLSAFTSRSISSELNDSSIIDILHDETMKKEKSIKIFSKPLPNVTRPGSNRIAVHHSCTAYNNRANLPENKRGHIND